MTNKKISIANNQLLKAICDKLEIPTEIIGGNNSKSIGGGGISRPTGGG